MSDEEKKAIESFKEENDNDLSRYNDFNSYTQFKVKRDKIIIDLIEKQSKEIEEFKNNNKPQPDCEEPIERTEEMVNMRWVNHNYILKSESEQKERKAYIKGTNDTHELCNKKWEDKIKAKIEEIDKEKKEVLKGTKGQDRYAIKQEYMYKRNILQSLLEKE